MNIPNSTRTGAAPHEQGQRELKTYAQARSDLFQSLDAGSDNESRSELSDIYTSETVQLGDHKETATARDWQQQTSIEHTLPARESLNSDLQHLFREDEESAPPSEGSEVRKQVHPAFHETFRALSTPLYFINKPFEFGSDSKVPEAWLEDRSSLKQGKDLHRLFNEKSAPQPTETYKGISRYHTAPPSEHVGVPLSVYTTLTNRFISEGPKAGSGEGSASEGWLVNDSVGSDTHKNGESYNPFVEFPALAQEGDFAASFGLIADNAKA